MLYTEINYVPRRTSTPEEKAGLLIEYINGSSPSIEVFIFGHKESSGFRDYIKDPRAVEIAAKIMGTTSEDIHGMYEDKRQLSIKNSKKFRYAHGKHVIYKNQT